MKKAFSLILAALILSGLSAAYALSPAIVPCDFYGYQVKGRMLSPGDQITVKDPQGVVCGSFTVAAAGQYGFLSCRADDPETAAVDEGAVEGDQIAFYCNDEKIANSGIWTSGGTVKVDIGFKYGLDEVSVQINKYYNQIGFAVLPEGLSVPYKASQFAAGLNGQGLDISKVRQWDGDDWMTYDISLSFTDYDLDLDQGIFVYNANNRVWTLTGGKIALPKTVNLLSGWNLIALPATFSGTKASDVAAQINAQGNSVQVLMYWDGDDWVSYTVGLPFGDFGLVKGRSYFIKCSSASAWQME